MKRVLAGLVVLLMLVGCTSAGSPEESNLVDEAIAAYNSANSEVETVEDINMVMTIGMTGETNLTIKMDFVLKNLQQLDNIEGYISMETAGENEMAEAYNLKMYIKDKFMYMEIMGMKVKTPLDESISQFADIPTGALSELNRVKLQKSEVKGVTKDAEGNYVIQLDDAKTTGAANSILEQQTGVDLDNMKIKSYAMVISPTGEVIGMNMVIDVEEETIGKIEMTYELKIVAINGDVKIEFPDLTEYTELTNEY